jgi:hypothetical protein
MDYQYVNPPMEANAGWMGHVITMHVLPLRFDELMRVLEESCGREHEQWRIERRSHWSSETARIRFKDKKHAMTIKLMWVEDVDPMDDILQKMSMTSLKYKNFMRLPGQGFRNQRMTTTKPFDIIDYMGMVSKDYVYRSLGINGAQLERDILDDCGVQEAKPSWHIDKCRGRGDDVWSTEQLLKRLSGEAE